MAGAVAAASADQKTPGAHYDVERMRERLLEIAKYSEVAPAWKRGTRQCRVQRSCDCRCG